MDPVNEPRSAIVYIRCAACGRSLGRWSVDELTPDLIIGAPRTRPRGRRSLVRSGPKTWDEVRSVPMRCARYDAWLERSAGGDVLNLKCTCRARRRVRISSHGLLRLLRRLGWPDEIEL